MFKRLIAALPLSVLLIAIASSASADNVFGGKWPPLPEGQSPKAGEIWGELPNGLRYVIVPTDSPSEAVSLRLLVAAGRAQEAKGKAGTSLLLADFAAFGTANVSREQLVQFKLANGIDPQSRSFSEVDVEHSLYRVDLEEPIPGAVEISIGLLAEIVGTPSFDKDVFEESKDRLVYSAGLDLGYFEPKQASLERALLRPGSHADYSDAAIRADAPSIELGDVEAYWSQWYKADRMVLVVTGVVDSAFVESVVKSQFAALPSSEALVPLAEKGSKFRSTGEAETAQAQTLKAGLLISHLSELGDLFNASEELEYYTLDFIGRVAQSYATGSDRLPGSVLSRYGDFVALSVNGGGPVVTFLEQLVAADKAVHRLAEYGVRTEDLKRAKSDYLDSRFGYDMQLSSREWAPLVADRAVRSVLDQVPFRYGADFSEYIEGVVSKITFDDIAERCKELFKEKELSYYLELPEAFALGAKTVNKRLKGMRKGYDFTWEQAGQSDQDWNVGLGFETGGMVKSTEIIQFEEYPVLKYEFENSVRMNVIRSDVFPGRVQVYLSLGNGTADLDNANPAFDSLVRSLLNKTKMGNGVESPTIREMLEAKGLDNVDVGVTDDNLYWSAVGRDASDVEYFLSAVMFWMVRSDLSEDLYDEEFESLEKIVDNGAGRNNVARLDELLFKADDRLRAFPNKEDLEALDYTTIREWLASVREKAYIEITVVGDVVPRTVLRDARKTFGSAPDRPGKVLQPRHGKPVKWSEPGIVHDTFKMPGELGNITLLFPQVAEKSCANDRMDSVLLPLFEEHLRRELAAYPQLAANLSVESIGRLMIPLSNAIKVRVYCKEEDAKEAETLLLDAAKSFEASLDQKSIGAAERNAVIGLKRTAQSQHSLVNLFKQSQGKPKTLSCVLDLLDNGFGISFKEYKQVAKLQFSEENVRGVVLMPAKK